MTVTVDTGSTDLWLGSTLLPAAQQSIVLGPLFNPNASATWASAPPPESLHITYSGGFGVTGQMGTDTVAVGNLTATAMAFTAAANISLTSQWKAGGLMGFGFQANSRATPDANPSFFESVKQNLDQPIFATNFKSGGSGNLDFGAVNEEAYVGDMTVLSVGLDSNPEFPNSWNVAGVSFIVGNGSSGNVSSSQNLNVLFGMFFHGLSL
jgi:aspergillopepsin I